MNGAEALLSALKNRGVRHVFGLPGTTEAALLEALREEPKLHYVLTLQEGATIAMADGYARASRGPAVANLHTTVGTLAGLSQMQNAWRDKVPLVVIGCHKSSRILGRLGFSTTINTPEHARPLAKWSYQTLHPDQIAEDTERAIHFAVSGVPGPTYLLVPEDFLAAGVPAPAVTASPSPRPVRTDARTIAEIAERLRQSRCPVLLAGNDIALSGAAARAVTLAEALGAPVLIESLRSLIQIPFPTDHPQYVGQYTGMERWLAEADLLLAVGANLFIEFAPARAPEIPPHVSLIHANQDPLEVGKLYAPSIGVQSDAGLFLDDLVEAMRGPSGVALGALAERLAFVQRVRAERDAMLSSRLAAESDALPLAVSFVATEMGRVLPSNTIIVEEAVRSLPAFLDFYPARVGGYHRTGGGALGWGVPAAVGVQLAEPDRPVVAVVGDGALHFTPQALWTASQERLPVVVVVLNNQKYLAVKAGIERFKGVKEDPLVQPGYELPGIDHELVARGYGALGGRVERPSDLARALSAALSQARDEGRPYLLDVLVRDERF